MSSFSGQSRQVASSWKEIAAHFGVTVRTAQLWESERGLPVHRMPGLKGRVYAYIDELEAWAAGKPIQPDSRMPQPAEPDPAPAPRRPRLPGWIAVIAILAVAIVAAVVWVSRPAPVPSSYETSGRTLTIKDAEGRPLWRHEFPGQIVPLWAAGAWTSFLDTRPWIGDIDADGKREVLFTYTAQPKQYTDSELYCFDSSGKVRWRYRPGRPVATRKERFAMPFHVRMVIAMDRPAGKPPMLLVVGTHTIYYPSQVAALSAQGEVLREYWHSGHINAATVSDLDSDGRPELYLLACHNATKTVDLIALDPEDFGGASRESNPDYQLLGLGPPRELGRVILPASELNRQLGDPILPTSLTSQSGRIYVGSEHSLPRPGLDFAPGVLHQFGPRLTPLAIEYTWTFKGGYGQLVKSGRIKGYDLDADLERLKKVEVVTPWRGASAPADGRQGKAPLVLSED